MSESANRVVIKKACAGDVTAIRQCAVEAYSKYIERIGKPPAPMVAEFEALVSVGQVVVACYEERLVGYVVYYQIRDIMHLENVAVYPAFSGMGIGKLLIRYVEDEARNLGLVAVELYTNEAMTENLSLYPALGYEEYDRRREAGFNRVYYRLQVVSAD